MHCVLGMVVAFENKADNKVEERREGRMENRNTSVVNCASLCIVCETFYRAVQMCCDIHKHVIKERLLVAI